MMHKLITRIWLLFLGLIAGFVLAFVLQISWYFFTLAVRSHCDSAPESFIRVQIWVECVITIAAVIVGLVASQWYYSYAHKKDRL